MKYKKILGIDFGEKNIGLALGFAGVVEPYAVVKSNEFFSKISTIINLENVELIVVGVSESKTAQKTKIFVSRLKNVVKLPIETVDETLTTRDALEVSKKRKLVDSISAGIILEHYYNVNGKE